MFRRGFAVAAVGIIATATAPPAAGQPTLLPGWLGTATVLVAEIEGVDLPAPPFLGTVSIAAQSGCSRTGTMRA
jgi:hypothetical protein